MTFLRNGICTLSACLLDDGSIIDHGQQGYSDDCSIYSCNDGTATFIQGPPSQPTYGNLFKTFIVL